MPGDMTGFQRKAAAAAVTAVSITAIGAFAILVLWGLARVFSFASPALVPLATGLFLAMFFKPYYGWWLKIAKNPSLAVLCMLSTVLLPAGAALWYGGSVAVSQIAGLVESAPERAESVSQWFSATFPNARALAVRLDIPYDTWTESLKDALCHLALGFLGYVSNLLNWLVSLVFFVYFVTRPDVRGADCVKEMPFLKDDTKKFVAGQIDAFIDIVVGFFQRQTAICLCEGVFYGLGFALVGLKYGFLIGFALGVLNLVPLFGSVVCLPVALPLALWGAGGGGLRLALVLGVWLAGQILDGYLITPRIQGNKTGLGYAGVIFSFFFWGAVFKSLLGLLFAIPLSAFCVVLWRAVKSRYIKPIV